MTSVRIKRSLLFLLVVSAAILVILYVKKIPGLIICRCLESFFCITNYILKPVYRFLKRLTVLAIKIKPIPNNYSSPVYLVPRKFTQTEMFTFSPVRPSTSTVNSFVSSHKYMIHWLGFTSVTPIPLYSAPYK